MKTCIVTSCDEKYIPGAIALYNSIKQNSNCESEVFLLAHGNESAYEDFPKDFKRIYNAEPVASPTGGEWTYEMPAMYSRVLIPKLFSNYDRVLWLDADTIVLQDLTPLFHIDLEGKICAAAKPSRDDSLNSLKYQLEDPSQLPGCEQIQAISSGVVLIDIKAWNSANIDSRVNELLLSNIRFKFVVQGVMSAALQGNYKVLDFSWNAYSHWAQTLGMNNVKILHYIGGHKVMPWIKKTSNQHIWEQYR